MREELNERQALVRQELNERQALVREKLNQERMKTAVEKESQIDKESPETIVLMEDHYNELVNTPSNAKEVQTRKSDRTTTT